MTAEAPPADDGRRPDSPAQRIDAACDRFEAAWRAGQEPRIEDVLARADETDRPALLRELLALELELRRGRGERVTPGAYRDRFPGQADVIAAVFAAADTRPGRSRPRPGQALADTGRNLLFGLLALQNNFISREALLGAFAVWTADKARPLSQVLRDRGALDQGRYALLEALVAEHLKLHGDDPEQSLAALSSLGSVRDDLERIDDADLQASLAATASRSAGSGGDAEATASSTSSSSGRAGGRFRIVRFHREGGLGRVYLARDEELGREVALKEIRPDKVAEAHLRGRFVLEAEINGGLEHPGIVPVYSLGTYDDGRPFYAMRFVEGDSLKEAIETYHNEHPRPDPSAIEFRKLLGRFIDVCEAIAFAHSKGVLHRDLKPHNVMLGRYGETLLIDWGLAKATGRREPAGPEAAVEATLVPPSGSGHEPTLGVIGSPAFMSPEQAAGAVESLGPATDVYGLGAILFALLTGEAPVEGGAIEEVLDRVRRGAIRSPRSLNPSIPRALEAVCLKALATEPKDRYPTALALAEEIEHWLADEPVTAYVEPMLARVRRWSRRHQRLVTGATAAGLVAAAALIVITAVISTWNQRLETTIQKLATANQTILRYNEQITRQNHELEESNANLKQARAEAERERDQAKEVTELLVTSFRRPDPARDGKDVKAAEVLDQAVKDLAGRPKMAPLTRATILTAVSETYRGLGLVAPSVATSEEALAIRRRELGEAHLGTLEAMNNLAGAHLAAGRLQSGLSLFEQILEARRLKQGEDHPDTLDAINNLGLAYHEAGQLDRAIPLLEQAHKAARAKLGNDHRDALSVANNLARAYQDAGRLDRAIPLFEQTLELRRAKQGEDHPDTLMSMHNLASVYAIAGQNGRAIPLLERTLKARMVKLGEDHPDTLQTINNLAVSYGESGQFDRAYPLMEQVLKVRLAKLGEDHPATLTAMSNLAGAYLRSGRLDQALPLLEQTLKASQVQQGPDHPDTLVSMVNLAVAYRYKGQFDHAISLLAQALKAHQTKLGKGHHQTLMTQRNLALLYEKVGRRQDAESLFREVVAAAGRGKPRNDPFYSLSQTMLGRCLIRGGKFAEAVPILRDSLAIEEELQPDDWTTAATRSLLGEALAGQREFQAAEPLLLNAQKALTEQCEKIPALEREVTLRDTVDRLVRLYEAWGKPDKAERWRKTLSENPLDRGFPADPFAR
ncbi:MAG TPA: tetratricopeptide repeat protein [Isosphaeraceae bacterium]|nr:tetratricopeptide repeat protein [Isosphaeraceae bacterium]